MHIAQIDVVRNGFTEAVKIVDMAEDHGLRVVNHFYTTGVNLEEETIDKYTVN